MGQFIGDLVVKVVSDNATGLFELVQPLAFQSDVVGTTITAPAGERTDFCSVPMVPGVYELLGGKARKSGTIHDHLYSSHELSREQADAALREMLLVEGVDHVEAEAFYLAVREFGGSHYWG